METVQEVVMGEFLETMTRLLRTSDAFIAEAHGIQKISDPYPPKWAVTADKHGHGTKKGTKKGKPRPK